MAKLKTLAKTEVMKLRRFFRRFDLRVKRAIIWPFRKLWRFKKLRRHLLPLAKLAHQHHRLMAGGLAGLMVLGVMIPVWQHHVRAERYLLSGETAALVGRANQNITDKIKYNPQTAKFEFNADKKAPMAEDGTPLTGLTAQAGGGSEDSEQQYSVDVSRSLSNGVTYYENNLGINFTLKPQFAALTGEKVEGGRLLYPLADGLGGQLIYTATSKGLKEDVVLHKKPSTDEVTLRYAIDLPDSLEIKLLDSGDLGVYSADPSLYGDIQYGDDNGREAIEKARRVAAKDHLAFVVPAPYVVGLNEHGAPERASLSSRFLLSDDKTTLSVITTGFSQTDESMYPLSIDPSVTVTSTSDFTDGGNDEDNSLTFGTDQISRREVSGGAIGAWSTTTSLPEISSYSRPVVYGGRLYVMINNNSSTVLRYTTINSNGTLGASWTLAANQPATATSSGGYELLLYSGRLYFVGGGAEKKQVEYSVIQASGSPGAWQETSTLQQSRMYFGASAYNGHLYAAGTVNAATTVVEYAAIKADGSLSAWQETTSLPNERAFGSMVVYGGHVYVVGGYYFVNGSAVPGRTLYASIGDNGALGAWTEADAITTGPYGELAGVTQANGYIYIVGGYGTTAGDSTSGQVTYGQITADGNVKPWRATTSVGTTGTYLSAGSVAYNGYLYAMGGSSGSGNTNTMRYAPIKTAGDVDNWTTSSGSGVRNNAASVVYGSYLYLLGGQSGTTGTALATNVRIPLNADGTLGTAITSTSTSTGSFATATRSLGAFARGGYMYAIGGTNAAGTTYLQTVQRSPINASTGALGTWSTSGLPQMSAGTGRWGHGVAFYNSRVYIAGGRFNSTSVSNAVLYTTLNSSGGMGASWTGAGNNFTTARTQHQLVQYGGYMYVLGGWNGTTVYSDVQYAKINADGTLNPWVATESLFGGSGGAVHSFGAFAANGYIYVLGGAKSSGVSTTTTKSQINADGSLSVWQQVSDSGGASVDRSYHTAAYANGYTYVYGGIPSSGGTGSNTSMRGRINNGGTGAISAQATAGSASPAHFSCTFTYQDTLYKVGGDTSMSSLGFNEDGSTGTWISRGSLPEARSGAGCAVDGNRVYLVGGYTTGGTLLSSVIHATINDDSSFSTWQTTTSLPVATEHGDSFVRNGYLYFMGGSTTSAIDIVRYAPINSGGGLGSWATTSPLYAGVAGGASVVVGSYVYIAGGINSGGNEADTTQYATINSDGTLSEWARASILPATRSYASAAASNGYLYLTGGQDSTATTVATVYYAPMNTDGTVGEWQSTTALPEASFGHQSLFREGRLYTIGGSTPFYQKVFYSTGIDMQTRQATYTKTIHAGHFGAITGVNYSGTFSGTDAVGVDYRVTSTSGEFGRTYDEEDVVDEGIDPTELCSTIEGAARAGEYIFVTVTIDDSAAALYSDAETANGSVVGAITLDYISPLRSPTEMRMRGGKWFSSNSLQTLDTCIPLSASTPAWNRELASA